MIVSLKRKEKMKLNLLDGCGEYLGFNCGSCRRNNLCNGCYDTLERVINNMKDCRFKTKLKEHYKKAHFFAFRNEE